jgi:hypothetical protein
LFVVHLNRLNFGGDTSGGEGDDHTSLDDTSFNSADGHRANLQSQNQYRFGK